MDKGKPGLAVIIGAKDDGPPPLTSPEGEPDLDDQPDSGTQTCAACMYYRDEDGRCQRFPPHGYEWSSVAPEDWCGEWRGGAQHKSSLENTETQQPVEKMA